MATERLNNVWLIGATWWQGYRELLLWDNCFYKAMAVSQAFIFHFKWYNILHFAVYQLLCWAFLFCYLISFRMNALLIYFCSILCLFGIIFLFADFLTSMSYGQTLFGKYISSVSSIDVLFWQYLNSSNQYHRSLIIILQTLNNGVSGPRTKDNIGAAIAKQRHRHKWRGRLFCQS